MNNQPEKSKITICKPSLILFTSMALLLTSYTNQLWATVEIDCGSSNWINLVNDGSPQGASAGVGFGSTEDAARLSCLNSLMLGGTLGGARSQVQCATCEGEGCELILSNPPTNPNDDATQAHVGYSCSGQSWVPGWLIKLFSVDDIFDGLGGTITGHFQNYSCNCSLEVGHTLTFEVDCTPCEECPEEIEPPGEGVTPGSNGPMTPSGR